MSHASWLIGITSAVTAVAGYIAGALWTLRGHLGKFQHVKGDAVHGNRGPVKYKTLAELKAAYDSGEIPRDEPLWLDNDTSHLYDHWNYPRDDDEAQESAVCVFSMEPYVIMTQALDLLGIPHDHV